MFFDHVPQKGLICAHRGARSIAPENTLLAMTKAKQCGANCWETDVRMSKDGELLIFHDASLERTTDIASHKMFRNRVDWHVEQFTLGELRELDAGSWFLRDDPFGTVASGVVGSREAEAIQGQLISPLREILNYSKSHSFPVTLEIKDSGTPLGDVSIVDRILEMLLETDTMDRVLLSSFRHEYLHRARLLSQDVAVAVLAKDQHPPDLLEYLRRFSAAAYHPAEAICDTELILQLQQAGFRVNIWTVNSMERAQELLRKGAGVITDWPQRLTRSVSENAYSGTSS